MHRFLFRLEMGVTAFIAPSAFMARRLCEWGIPQTRIRIVPNFVAHAGSADPRPGDCGIYVGRLSSEKGLDILLRALSSAGDPPFEIVGDGPLSRDLLTLSRRLGLKRTRFAGRLSPRDVMDRVATARYLVMPSLSEENAPLAVLEAMARGRPVIVSRRGGLPELVEAGGGLVSDAGDEQGLAVNIGRLTSDDDLCAQLGASALATARQRFSPEVHLTLLEMVYEAVCSGDQRSWRERGDGTSTRRGSLAD
jgi:glycosyltransferase involved in cell wall biosynthesis